MATMRYMSNIRLMWSLEAVCWMGLQENVVIHEGAGQLGITARHLPTH